MKWGAVIGITFIVILVTLYEWPKMNKGQKKEKLAYATLMMSGWLLAVLLIFVPDIPGPTQLVDVIFKPLGKILDSSFRA
jgi:multisubunit Na+/H+ antiporter MnhB subunit